MSHITPAMPYRSAASESPLRIYGQNCIINGGEFTCTLKDNTSNIINVTISPGQFLLSNTLLVLNYNHVLDLDLTPYSDRGTVLVLAMYCPCSNLSLSSFYYRLAYLSENGEQLLPAFVSNSSSSTDLFETCSSLILGTVNFSKDLSNTVFLLDNNTPDRKEILSYINNPYVIINNIEHEIMPFDRLTDRLCELMKNQTGGTGNSGTFGLTGGTGNIGNTGNTGETGDTGGTGIPGAGKSYLHLQIQSDSIWKINHQLDEKYIMVQCINSNDEVILPKSIKFIDNNLVLVDFGREVKGKAICIGGKRGGSAIGLSNNTSYTNLDRIFSITGLTGATGSRGDRGPQGIQGIQGPPGDPGAAGRDGRDGCCGPVGPRGPKGDPGVQGPPGCASNTGGSGRSGGTGATGATGAIGITGTTGATGGTGNIGRTGVTGASGATGATGGTGKTGRTGQTGASGATGGTGKSGSRGLQGDVGSRGPTGATGGTGKSGSTGPRGIQGIQGNIGPIGPPGNTGATGSHGIAVFALYRIQSIELFPDNRDAALVKNVNPPYDTHTCYFLDLATY